MTSEDLQKQAQIAALSKISGDPITLAALSNQAGNYIQDSDQRNGSNPDQALAQRQAINQSTQNAIQNSSDPDALIQALGDMWNNMSKQKVR